MLAWTVVGLLYFGQDVTRRLYWGDPIPWYEARFWIVRVLISAALTPGVLWLGRRWAIEPRNWITRIWVHLVFSAGFALVRVLLEAAIQTPLDVLRESHWDQDIGGAVVTLLTFGFHAGVAAYWVILSLQLAFRYYAKSQVHEREKLELELHASELKARVAQAQLAALKMQLQPHFLFNTLNAIVVLVRQQKGPQAEEALMCLSDLLRAVLEDIDAQEVPLRREIACVQLYLSIEKMRFRDRLTFRLDVGSALLDAAVPQMALQPIVENSVRHGIGPRAAGGAIELRAHRVANELHIIIADDGVGFCSKGSPGHGVGLSNLRVRLRQLYGHEANLQVRRARNGGAEVSVVLPYRESTLHVDKALVMAEFENDEEAGRAL